MVDRGLRLHRKTVLTIRFGRGHSECAAILPSRAVRVDRLHLVDLERRRAEEPVDVRTGKFVASASQSTSHWSAPTSTSASTRSLLAVGGGYSLSEVGSQTEAALHRYGRKRNVLTIAV
jgi:hypothetical protein